CAMVLAHHRCRRARVLAGATTHEPSPFPKAPRFRGTTTTTVARRGRRGGTPAGHGDRRLRRRDRVRSLRTRARAGGPTGDFRDPGGASRKARAFFGRDRGRRSAARRV